MCDIALSPALAKEAVNPELTHANLVEKVAQNMASYAKVIEVHFMKALGFFVSNILCVPLIFHLSHVGLSLTECRLIIW